jgi:hypothetical protein
MTDLDLALDLGRRAGSNALEASAKTPSIKSFVNTSSSTAASFAKTTLANELFIDDQTYNDEAIEVARATEVARRNFSVYSAMKNETEKAMWQWVKEKQPGFRMNCIVSLPSLN